MSWYLAATQVQADGPIMRLKRENYPIYDGAAKVTSTTYGDDVAVEHFGSGLEMGLILGLTGLRAFYLQHDHDIYIFVGETEDHIANMMREHLSPLPGTGSGIPEMCITGDCLLEAAYEQLLNRLGVDAKLAGMGLCRSGWSVMNLDR